MKRTSHRYSCDFRYWHFSDLPARPLYVRFWGYFRPQMLAASISQSDP
jgi:hypothetical protein